MITLSRFAVGLLFISSASAFFRLPCSKPVLNANVDPIVSPGVPSSHSHTIMGSGGMYAPFRRSNASVKVNLTGHISHWPLHYICRLAQFQLLDVQSQG
jgi:hypothetical protein